ncbi:hypothetical protein ADUPG1_000222, partial [Aduncisulcus paluster]
VVDERIKSWGKICENPVVTGFSSETFRDEEWTHNLSGGMDKRLLHDQEGGKGNSLWKQFDDSMMGLFTDPHFSHIETEKTIKTNFSTLISLASSPSSFLLIPCCGLLLPSFSDINSIIISHPPVYSQQYTLKHGVMSKLHSSHGTLRHNDSTSYGWDNTFPTTIIEGHSDSPIITTQELALPSSHLILFQAYYHLLPRLLTSLEVMYAHNLANSTYFMYFAGVAKLAALICFGISLIFMVVTANDCSDMMNFVSTLRLNGECYVFRKLLKIAKRQRKAKEKMKKEIGLG